jgi:hypothetical protein
MLAGPDRPADANAVAETSPATPITYPNGLTDTRGTTASGCVEEAAETIISAAKATSAIKANVSATKATTNVSTSTAPATLTTPTIRVLGARGYPLRHVVYHSSACRYANLAVSNTLIRALSQNTGRKHNQAQYQAEYQRSAKFFQLDHGAFPFVILLSETVRVRVATILYLFA